MENYVLWPLFVQWGELNPHTHFHVLVLAHGIQQQCQIYSMCVVFMFLMSDCSLQ